MTKVKLTAEYDNQKVVYSFPMDSDIQDYMTVFKAILIFFTFSPVTVDEAFGGGE